MVGVSLIWAVVMTANHHIVPKIGLRVECCAGVCL